MKKTLSQAAYAHVRLLVSLTLVVAALSLALPAFGSWQGPLMVAHLFSFKKESALEAKKELKERGESRAMKSSPGSRSKRSASAGQNASANALQPMVTKHVNALGQTIYSVGASDFDISPPLTELAKLSVPKLPYRVRPEPELPRSRILSSIKRDSVTQVVPGSDVIHPPLAPDAPTAPTAASTGFNFDGVPGGVLLVEDAGYPPDTNGSVGNNQYVEMVNTRYQVWSLNRTTKTATSVLGPVSNNTIWANFGAAGRTTPHPCQDQNAGDPVVLYDKLANRWFLSQFTADPDSEPSPHPMNGSFYQCVAVSTTPDAAGAYARYAFPVPKNTDVDPAVGDFGDYPHYGVWPDGYYVMAHHFTPDESASSGFAFHGGSFGAMDRVKMLAGDPSATYQLMVDKNEGGHMPADVDGFAPPPAGAPGIFASVHKDGMYIYRLKVDFAAGTAVRTLQAVLPVADASAACGGGNCIPQPNSPVTLDSLADRLMFRVAYRNFVDHESLTVTHAVDPGVPGVVSGVRWYEFRLSGQPDAVCSTYPCTYQQGTIADAPNGRSRWMSSIAQDSAGNMIVGYSTTGSLEPVDAHSIRYTGRAVTDPLGTMTVPETIIFTGNRNEVADNTLGTLPGRWGDYASTSIDPADDCTFWHANEYYQQGYGATNFEWRTRIASASFSASQCQPTTCTSRPTSAPAIGAVTAIAPNKIEVSWSAVSPAPGSYAIERKAGAPGTEGLYEPVGFVPASSTTFIDTTVQGGYTYSYRIIAATDAAGRCQAFVRSNAGSATATGACTAKPVFGGLNNATSIDGPTCGVLLSWSPAVSNCPLTPNISYNVYRGVTPNFVPSPANRVASCIAGNSFVDTDNLVSGKTYYYVVRAEDNSTGNGGACGGNEESNTKRVAGTAYGPGTQATPGTWTDGGGDGTSFLRLNVSGSGNTTNPNWRIVTTGDDPGANHTPGGDFAYRNTGPGPDAIYDDLQCSAAETPVLTVGANNVNLTYWERHQFENGWDGVALEYSRNGGAWVDLPAPSNSTADGCMSSDATGDYAPLECTDDPPINACAYPATKPVITGPGTLPVNDCTAPPGNITNYARRCHRITGLTAGDTIQFRWRFTSDPATGYRGFYLDDIAVTNIRLPNACVAGTPTTPTPIPEVTRALNLSTRMNVQTGDNAGIGGFIITGSVPKHVLIRGLGPSLTNSGFSSSELLSDPTLELHGPQGFAALSNNNWKDSQQAAIENTGLQPSNNLEAAIDATLAPGAYTAILRDNNNGVGIGLVEIYDLEAASMTKLGNLSTRALVGTGKNVVIAGFILGNNGGTDRIIIRGLGPSLSDFGVSNPLQDPTLELRNQNGALLRANNDWEEDGAQAIEIGSSGLAPSRPKESAIAATLSPGLYTAILAGANGGQGVGTVEVYDRGP
jgi:hypothetical protein